MSLAWKRLLGIVNTACHSLLKIHLHCSISTSPPHPLISHKLPALPLLHPVISHANPSHANLSLFRTGLTKDSQYHKPPGRCSTPKCAGLEICESDMPD